MLQNKKITIILLVLLIFPFVNASITTDLWARFPLTTDEDDVINGLDGTNVGVVFGGTGGDFESTESDELSYTHLLLTNHTENGNVADFSICAQFNVESLGSTRVIYGESDGSNNGVAFRIRDIGGSVYKLNWFPTDVATIDSTTTITTTTDYTFCGVYNHSTGFKKLYLNGNYEKNGTDTITQPTGVATAKIGDWAHINQNFDGLIKEICMWNRTISKAEIQNYATNVSCTASAPPSTPSLTINSNLQNKSIDDYTQEKITYNGTFDSHSTDIVNCSLWVKAKDTGNYLINTSSTDVNISTSKVFTYDYPFIDNNIYFKIRCENSEVNTTTNEYKYIVDTTKIFNYQKNLEILELLQMIPLILLYAVICYLTYYTFKFSFISLGLGFTLFGFDLYLVTWIYDTYISGNVATTWQGQFIYIFGLMLYVFIVTKLVSVFFVRYTAIKNKKGVS